MKKIPFSYCKADVLRVHIRIIFLFDFYGFKFLSMKHHSLTRLNESIIMIDL